MKKHALATMYAIGRPGYPAWLSAPAVAWMVCFFVLPLVIVLLVSFATRGTYGGVIWQFTLGSTR
ncbi:MAG TPA: hypothetical protein VHF07_05845, partial [Nitrospiraceae bacterium]|nr:hypothetical protein [Nitrospiraceae bacterium]